LRRTCLLQHVIEVKIEGKRRRGRRSKELLDDLKERIRCWKLKDITLDSPVWRIPFGRVYRPFVRHCYDDNITFSQYY
jgi:hypothetical protein